MAAGIVLSPGDLSEGAAAQRGVHQRGHERMRRRWHQFGMVAMGMLKS